MKLVELNKKEQDEIILFLSDFVVVEKQGGEGAGGKGSLTRLIGF